MDKQVREALREFRAESTKDKYQEYLHAARRAQTAFQCYFCPRMIEHDAEWLQDQGFICECGAVACSDCSLNFVCGDADCNVTGCPDCLDKCPNCKLNICPGSHNTICSVCNKEFCLDCTRYCDDCGVLFCLNHLGSSQDLCHGCQQAEDDDLQYFDDFDDDDYQHLD